jgi:hypothetical protein
MVEGGRRRCSISKGMAGANELVQKKKKEKRKNKKGRRRK